MRPFLAYILSFCLFISLGSTARLSLTDAKDKGLSIISNPTPSEIAKRAQKKVVPWWNNSVSRKILSDFQSALQPYPITYGSSFPILMTRRCAKMAISLKIKIFLADMLSLSTVFDSYAFAIVSVLFDLLDFMVYFSWEKNVLLSGLFPFICLLYLHAEVSVVHALCWQTSCMESTEPLTMYLSIFECMFAWVIHDLLHKHMHPATS